MIDQRAAARCRELKNPNVRLQIPEDHKERAGFQTRNPALDLKQLVTVSDKSLLSYFISNTAADTGPRVTTSLLPVL